MQHHGQLRRLAVALRRLRADSVGGNVQLTGNAGTGNTISHTTVVGNLQCTGNHDVSGSGNTVTGNRQGQCAGL